MQAGLQGQRQLAACHGVGASNGVTSNCANLSNGRMKQRLASSSVGAQSQRSRRDLRSLQYRFSRNHGHSGTGPLDATASDLRAQALPNDRLLMACRLCSLRSPLAPESVVSVVQHGCLVAAPLPAYMCMCIEGLGWAWYKWNPLARFALVVVGRSGQLVTQTKPPQAFTHLGVLT